MNRLKKIYRKIFKNKTIHPDYKVYKEWRENGKSCPPPHIVKQYIIKNHQRETHYNILIETGTYYGEMIDSQLDNFEKIISIELSKDLYTLAIKKYKNIPKVELYNGDSGELLIDVMKKIEVPALFWLDGHYSEGVTARGNKDCPIIEELTAILNATYLPHLILIDDARLFVGENDYPTITELDLFIKKRRSDYSLIIEEDIIKIQLK